MFCLSIARQAYKQARSSARTGLRNSGIAGISLSFFSVWRRAEADGGGAGERKMAAYSGGQRGNLASQQSKRHATKMLCTRNALNAA